MSSLEDAARAFLAVRRIAVAGVSRKGDTAANVIYRKLRETGYEVIALNPHADVVEGDPCYHALADIPDGVEAVVIGTAPAAAADLVRACHAAGVRKVWIHRSFGGGSLSDEAVQLCTDFGIDVIPGSCPMMFCEPVDFGHKCFKWMFGVIGRHPVPIGH